ncbi:acyl--CoA ligase family protein [Nocardioides sp. LS1]|uniref:acyl--CoA ligase family protein n=1 Tax=Nocardioides sp. LS1 TaxID=1027620 RepID=UPI000F617458|nr:acyl--CoA ligase family protein [Nocardioides sp. LS1]GCD90011.1 acyl-CoA synthetase [Nocardioides sp. LS1]
MADFTFTELTPTSFLERSAQVYADRTALVDGDLRLTYGELAGRCRALTGVLADLGVGPGDRVAVLASNSHVQLEMHHAVPLRGAVLVPINIRLSPAEVGYILEHAGASLLVVSVEYVELGTRVAAAAGVPLLVEGPDYESRIAGARPAVMPLADERSLLGINYTSGTTGRPKGVMTHHRGAYLQSLSLLVHGRMDSSSTYLWTLPMFHCNGWCLTWGVTAVGGTHVCLRAIDPERIWSLLRTEGVTHFSAAPTVLTMIAAASGADGPALTQRVAVQTGGSPPSPTLLARLDRLGMDVTHLYGLTETFGPIGINEWQPAWDAFDADAKSRLRARQGVGNVIAEPLRVADDRGIDVPRDGATVGEILARGNDLMLGYYRDDEATAAVTLAGWFRTGDLAVHHPDGYVEIRDRAKDIIISGGENIASVEVERAIDSHPDVVESAVVGVPDERWGEVPVAFVTVRNGSTLTGEEVVAHVREHLAGFKVPRRVLFAELPKTSTGKIQKQVLRETAVAEVTS